MADPRIHSRRDSYSHSETSDAGSSSTSIREPNSDTSARQAPIVRAEPAAPLTPVVPPPMFPPLPVQGAPAPNPAMPQQASAPTITKAEPPEWEWDAKSGILTLNKIFLFNEDIQKLLADHPDVKHVVIQPNLVVDNALGVINLLEAAKNMTSIHFSRPKNADHGYDDVPYLSSESARALADLAKKNPALTKLSFENAPFMETVFFEAFATVMKDNLTIEVIDISKSEYCVGHTLDWPLGDNIAALLIHVKGIKTINAPRNTLVATSGKTIAAALAMNRSLTTLDIGHNKINSDGAKAIFDGLRKNKKTVLSKLDLSNCITDAQSAKSLCKLLKQNTSLKEIVVGHVKSPEAAQYIAKGLSANKSGCIVRYN